MYSGTTLRVKSGRLIGVHQRIDRLAHRYLMQKLNKHQKFPSSRQILHFEGKNGPDGIKQKHPARDEPWHFIDPNHPEKSQIVDMIKDHQHNLVVALQKDDQIRAAFEAAWMSHAITDGLTPAHHYPFEDKLIELRGTGNSTRTSILKKNLMPGNSTRQFILNNWEYWGAKGVMTTHILYEYGTAMAIAGRQFESAVPDDKLYSELVKLPVDQLFNQALAKVDSLQIYQSFTHNGWTSQLTRQTNEILMPTIIRTVLIAWAQAIEQAGQKS